MGVNHVIHIINQFRVGESQQVLDRLTNFLHHQDSRIRRAAGEAIVRSGGEPALATLEKAAQQGVRDIHPLIEQVRASLQG